MDHHAKPLVSSDTGGFTFRFLLSTPFFTLFGESPVCKSVCGKLNEKTDLRSQRFCSRFTAATMSNILTGDFIVRGYKAMCGRYYISQEDEADAIRKILEILEPKLPPEQKLKTHGEIFPTDLVPVLANNRALQQTPYAMRWGYLLDNRNLINARSETASEKTHFQRRHASAQMPCASQLVF